MERRLLTLRMVNGMTLSLQRHMNLLVARQRLVASNSANADTLGYKTRDFEFQSEFWNALYGGSTPVVREVDTRKQVDTIASAGRKRGASDEASYETGTTLLIDGGMTLIRSSWASPHRAISTYENELYRLWLAWD